MVVELAPVLSEMPTKMQVITSVTVATFLSVVCAFCCMSVMSSSTSTSSSSSLTSRKVVDNGRKTSTSITFIVPTRRKELSTTTLAVSKRKKKTKENGVDVNDGDVVKHGGVIDRIDVYNQYDEENIEIDEQPVSPKADTLNLRDLSKNRASSIV